MCTHRHKIIIIVVSLASYILTANTSGAHWLLHKIPKSLTLSNVSDSLSDAIKALDGLVTLADRSVSTGIKISDCMSIIKNKPTLISFSSKLTASATGSQKHLASMIDSYLAHNINRQQKWKKIAAKTEESMQEVLDLLNICRSINNDFVLEESYRNIESALQESNMVFSALNEMEFPQTNSELSQLREIKEKYLVLISSLIKATNKLNEYVKLSMQSCSQH